MEVYYGYIRANKSFVCKNGNKCFRTCKADRLFTSELQCQIKKRDSWRKRFKKIADILDITYGQSFNLLNENKIESTN